MKKGIFGVFCGILNGLFGSGGGLVAVPLLGKSGLPPKQAHATSVAIIFFLSIISSAVYFFNGNLDIAQGMSYIPGGIVGAVTGSFILKKIDNIFHITFDFFFRNMFNVVIFTNVLNHIINTKFFTL